ncbi:MAG: hypothetical protein LQ346_007440 [Caloplaca aetnensis]|nr:MAG: hypothetical protein LQ346_007440 [Caloplaca aetnensis]
MSVGGMRFSHIAVPPVSPYVKYCSRPFPLDPDDVPDRLIIGKVAKGELRGNAAFAKECGRPDNIPTVVGYWALVPGFSKPQKIACSDINPYPRIPKSHHYKRLYNHRLGRLDDSHATDAALAEEGGAEEVAGGCSDGLEDAGRVGCADQPASDDVEMGGEADTMSGVDTDLAAPEDSSALSEEKKQTDVVCGAAEDGDMDNGVQEDGGDAAGK